MFNQNNPDFPCHILMVDDDASFHQLLAPRLMAEGFFVTSCLSSEEGQELLKKHYFDILLLDIFMPGMDGFQFCLDLRRSYHYFSTYIILITATTDEDSKVLGFQCGADDFMSKPIQFGELLARLRHAQKDLEIRKQVLLDQLTKVYNRFSFNELIVKEIESAKRYQLELSLLLINIDHFEDLNNQLGFEIGDRILKGLATILKRSCRGSDTVSRWSGSEFVMLLSNTEGEGGQLVASRLLETIQKHDFECSGTVTVSIGGSSFHKEVGAFYQRADQALFMAKERGGNQVCWLPPSED